MSRKNNKLNNPYLRKDFDEILFKLFEILSKNILRLLTYLKIVIFLMKQFNSITIGPIVIQSNCYMAYKRL